VIGRRGVPRQLEIRFSRTAQERLEALSPRRRGMLGYALRRLATAAPAQRFVTAKTPMDVGACEVNAGENLLLVYAVVPRRELLRELWGSAIDDRINARCLDRLARGRGWLESRPSRR
jgi:hypothetical protein